MPALKLHDHLVPKFRSTKLQYVLEGAEKSIMEARQSTTDSELRIALANLMHSLKPWMLEGKPQYYKEKGEFEKWQSKLWFSSKVNRNNWNLCGPCDLKIIRIYTNKLL